MLNSNRTWKQEDKITARLIPCPCNPLISGTKSEFDNIKRKKHFLKSRNLSLERVVIGNVTFEPGCRNFWHIHHKGGQVLLVTGGRGWYQEAGKPARELRAGNDDMNDIFKKILAADVLVLATPVYFYAINAQMPVDYSDSEKMPEKENILAFLNWPELWACV